MSVTTEAGHDASRVFLGQDGNLNLNGASLLVPTGSTITIDSGATFASAATVTHTGGETFSGGVTVTTANVTITDVNVVLSATTGTKIGTATTQKLGFYNATPIVQPAGTANVTGFVAGVGTASKSDSVWAGAAGSTAYTVGDVVTALKALGLLAA